MVNSFVCFCLVRLGLPVVLGASIAFRPNGFSFLYLLLLLYLPHVPSPTKQTIAGLTGRFLKGILGISLFVVIAQLVFQIVLLSYAPYAHFLIECDFLESLLRLIGLVRLDSIYWEDGLRYIAPDFIVLFYTVATWVLCTKLQDPPQNPIPVPSEEILPSTAAVVEEGAAGDDAVATSADFSAVDTGTKSSMLTLAGKYIALASLGLAGVLRPSVTSALYFLCFLGGATWWSCYKELQKAFGWVCRFCMVIAALHVIALFVYQLQWIQEYLPPDDEYARLFGLTQLIVTNCTDPRHLIFSEEEWASFLNPFAILWLYYILTFSSRLLVAPPLLSGQRRPKYQTMTTAAAGDAGLLQDASGSLIWSRGESITSEDSIRMHVIGQQREEADVDMEDEAESGDLQFLLDAVVAVIQMINRSSYIATNIIMMAWSITYHSWLTFILLLWACVLWMMPNQRKAMLRASPGLVLYAILLLLSQYVYAMNLTDDELPQTIESVNLSQIGFVKYPTLPCIPLLVKSLYTVMFWITLRQFMQEKWEEKNASALEGMAQEPFNITVTTTSSGQQPVSEIAPQNQKSDTAKTPSPFMKNMGIWIKGILTKFWIWVVAIMLFVIGLGGSEVVLYRIVYMALFLVFVLTFQLSYSAWRKMMYCFWVTVILYSMVILVLIYTYQFDNFPMYWYNYTGIPIPLQQDIGLEVYNTGALFVRLLTPTFFVIITVIQLHYFHKDFLANSDITVVPSSEDKKSQSSNVLESSSPVKFEEQDEDKLAELETTEPKPSLIDNFTIDNLKSFVKEQGGELLSKVRAVYAEAVSLFWRFLEVHMIKIVLLSVLLLACYDVSALHFLFAFAAIVALPCNTAIKTGISHFCSILASVLLLAKMIYQIDYIDHSQWDVNCTEYNASDPNEPFYNGTVNNAEWIGFKKTDNLPQILKGYIGLILVMTIQAVVKIRQKYDRLVTGAEEPQPGIIYPGIVREDADKSILPFLKFSLNYAFYKFGVEICLLSTVAVIGTRLDFYSVVYSLWLGCMFIVRRKNLARIWPFYMAYILGLLPIQYLVCVGIPPGFCLTDPTGLGPELNYWLFLPNSEESPESYKLATDYILLMFVCLQYEVFKIEKTANAEYYSGGTNVEITLDTIDPKVNPVPDFITYTRNWLDIVKRTVLLSFFWITLAIVFLTGTNRVNLFALGYLLGSFIFLWKGNDFYLMPRKVILKWWNNLMAYNVSVIFLKSLLQLLGCVYLSAMQYNFCWFVHLFGIACLKKFSAFTSREIAKKITACIVPTDEAGLMWDGICFGFLLLQRRFFTSYYFFHIVEETKAQTILASRGAELIEILRRKQIKEQLEEERNVLEKIKQKMERIKATHQKSQAGFRQPQSHYEAIRSGDYYMFEEYDEEELELLSDKDEEEEEEEDRGGVTISKLLSSAMKTDMRKAAEKARQSRKSEPDIGGETSDTDDIPRRRGSKRRSSRSVLSARSFQKSGPSDDSEREPPKEPPASSPKDQPEPLAIEDEDGVALSHTADGPLRKFCNFVSFSWQFIESLLVSATNWLNKFSRDYRYVSFSLAREKLQLKESSNGYNTAPLSTSHSQKRPDDSDEDTKEKQRPLPKDTVEIRIEKASEDGELDIEDAPVDVTSEEHQPDSLDLISVSDVDHEEDFSSDKPPIIQFIAAVWYVIVSHSELVCYFMIFLNQMKSASILSLPLPLLVFLWGSISVPRPSKNFWVTVITYTEAVVLMKWIFQFEYIPWNHTTSLSPFWAPRIFGIEKKEKYAMYDLSVLMVVFFHRFMLKSMGLWKNMSPMEEKIKTEDSSQKLVESIQEDPTSNPPSLVSGRSLLLSTSTAADESQVAGCGPSCEKMRADVKDHIEKLPDFKVVMQTGVTSTKTFFQDLLNPAFRVSADVYAYMFMCDFFNFFVVIFGFSAFGTQQGDGGVSSYLEENKVPIPFLVMLILQFGLIIIDRALYLRKFILGKLMFQLVLIGGVHLWMFFILPGVTERKFNDNLPPQIWYMVKCFYLLLSAYQIRSGYPTRILGNFFCKKYNYLNMYLFKGFMTIPFLFELRALMDWIWTDTSMTLPDWLKLEDIFANIFQLKCQRRVEKEYPQPRGEKKKPLVKYSLGGGFLFVIIAIIWFPLVLFALGNTVGEPNPPTAVSVEITVEGYQPIFQMTAQQNSLNGFTTSDWNAMNNHYSSDGIALTFLSNYDAADVYVAKLNGNSTANWGISPPAQDKLIEEVMSNKTMNMKLTWKISRKSANPTVPAEVKDDHVVPLEPNSATRTLLAKMINGSEEVDPVKINKIMPKFIKVTNTGKAQVVTQLSRGNPELEYRNLMLRLRRGTFGTLSMSEEWWEVDEDCSKDGTKLAQWLPYFDNCRYLDIYTFNEKAFPQTLSFLSGGGIIGLYTTLVLVASKIVREFFAGVSYKIMFDDMPNVDRILQLCLDIYLVRESRELALEEDLFAKLIFLYRSPETLIKWTRPKYEEEEAPDT